MPDVQHQSVRHSTGTATYENLAFVQRVLAANRDRDRNADTRVDAGPVSLDAPNHLAAPNGSCHNRNFSALYVGRIA